MTSRSPLSLVPSHDLALLPEERSALPAILSAEVSREAVLERIDPDLLQSAPLNLLISTALAISPQDALSATEDAVLRQTAALTEVETSLAAHARISAENLVLANVEYQASIQAYAKAELEAPVRSEWNNAQHFLEALKVHERRMDRHLRTRREAFERVERAGEIYRKAVLTRDGRSMLESIAIAQRPVVQSSAPTTAATSSDGKNVLIVVQ